MRIDRMVIRAGGLSREAASELARRVAAELATAGGAAEMALAGDADRDRITVRLTASAGAGAGTSAGTGTGTGTGQVDELAGRAVADLRRQLGRAAP